MANIVRLSSASSPKKAPALADFLDDEAGPVFPDPVYVGSPEYRAIHDLAASVLQSLGPSWPSKEEATDALVISLAELENWAYFLRTRLALAARHT
jgi:hypothetical protein